MGSRPTSPVAFDPAFRPFPESEGRRQERDGRDQAGTACGSGGERPGGPSVVLARCWGEEAGALLCSRSSISTEILVALCASTPQPHHVLAPSMPSSMVRSQPHECLRWEIRPSDPVRHLTSFRKRREDSTAVAVHRDVPSSGWRHASPQAQLGLHLRFAIATVGRHRFGTLPNRACHPGDGGTSMGASGELPFSTRWSTTMPSTLSVTCAL